MKNKNNRIQYLVLTAVIAALYFGLTFISYPIAFGPIQLRLSEALMLTVPLIPAAVPGVTLGCFLANFFNPTSLGPVDYLGGTLATFLATLWTRRLHKRLDPSVRLWDQRSFYLLPLPSVVVNGAIVGIYLPFLITAPNSPGLLYVLSCVVTFSLSEALVVYLLGLSLYSSIYRLPLIKSLNFTWSEQ